MSEVKFDETTLATINRKFIWFAPRNVPYYQKDTEPKLYPDLYVKYVPLALLEESQKVIDANNDIINELRKDENCAWKFKAIESVETIEDLQEENKKLREALEKAQWFHQHIMGEKKRVNWGATFDIDWVKVNDALISVDDALAKAAKVL